MKRFISFIKEDNDVGGANTSWTSSDGEHTITLQELIHASHHIPVQKLSVEKMAPLSIHNDRPNRDKRIGEVKLDHPILVMGNKILDGNHRVLRAQRDGATHIDGKHFEVHDLHPSIQDKVKKIFM